MADPARYLSGLGPVTLKDQSYLSRILSRPQEPLSDYSFANIYIWCKALDLYWATIDKHVCVFTNGLNDLTMLLPPMAEDGATEQDLISCIKRCFEIMDGYNDVFARRSRSRIEYISEELFPSFEMASQKLGELSFISMCGDYIYDTKRLIDLEGRDLKSKRKAKIKFEREYSSHFTEPLTPVHFDKCMELLAMWNAENISDGNIMEGSLPIDVLRERETEACRLALYDGERLKLKGMVMYANDQIAGFTLGEALTSKQCSILIEKTNRNYPGSAQYIFSEFCRQYWDDCPECNVGDDWGIPGIRRAKETYRPIRMINKYALGRLKPYEKPVVRECSQT